VEGKTVSGYSSIQVLLPTHANFSVAAVPEFPFYIFPQNVGDMEQKQKYQSINDLGDQLHFMLHRSPAEAKLF
jgi:hypothetical protein